MKLTIIKNVVRTNSVEKHSRKLLVTVCMVKKTSQKCHVCPKPCYPKIFV